MGSSKPSSTCAGPVPASSPRHGASRLGAARDDAFRPRRLLRVGVDDLGARHVAAERELFFSRRKVRAEIAALDPAPLHVREVVDQPDDRQQPVVGRPAQLLLGEPAGRGDDLLPLPANESEKELGLVRRRGRTPRCAEARWHARQMILNTSRMRAGVGRVAVDRRERLPRAALRAPHHEVVRVGSDGRDRAGRGAFAHEDATVVAAGADRPRAAADTGERERDRPVDERELVGAHPRQSGEHPLDRGREPLLVARRLRTVDRARWA